MLKYRTTVVLIVALLTAACGGGGDSASASAHAPPTYTYTVPAQNGDGWETGHLDDHGFDTAVIIDMMNKVLDGTYPGLDGIAIARNNTLLMFTPLRRNLDQYDSWIGNTDLNRHVLHSTSKSVTSALIGIAIDQGYIQSTDTLFYDMFSYGTYRNWDERKSEMTIEDVLTMRLGLKWDEWSEPYGEPDNDLQILTSRHSDFAKALLDLPMESNPGTTFAYNTAASIALGQALENAVGIPMANFANLTLFQPMQITNADWLRTPTGLPNGGSGLFLEPRDMLKFGQLFISGGVWNGQQIISSKWVNASVQRHVNLSWTLVSGYGYQWWLDKFQYNGANLPSWSTQGYGGQYIFCIPSLDLVVAFTSRNYGEAETTDAFELMQNYILAAIETAN